MEVILTQDVDNLGEKNDVVSIKAGYGRNFLIPQGFAKVANETNRKILAENLKQQSHKLAAILETAKANATKVEGASIKVATKVGKEDKIFGSITNLQLTDALNAATGLSQETLNSIGNEGRKNITKKFDVEVMCDSTFREYKKLLDI